MLRARPVLEGLEGRQLLSAVSPRRSVSAASSGGVLSSHGTEFSYETPTGGRAIIRIDGLGNLAGTTVDSSGALHLVYGGTNTFSAIVSNVHGGDGLAPLASIENSQLVAAGAENSLSGVGGNVLQAVYLKDFNLIAGGSINLTSGVNTVSLNAVGPDTQIHLRELPEAIQPSTIQADIEASKNSSASSSSSSFSSSSSSSSSTSTIPLMMPGVAYTNTSSEGIATTYVRDKSGAVTLTAVSGTFTAGSNIVEPLPAGQPPQTPPPAPPGVILRVNQIGGDTTGPINVLTDPVIFGYDPTTGDVIRFVINLTDDTGTVDSTFAPIPVPGDPASAGLNLGWDGSQLVVLVSSGTTVYAYNATTGVAVGSFTASEPINSIATADTVTVLGSYATNQLQMINLPASLQTGVEQPATGSPQNFSPAAGFTLLGGLTGLPGSTSVTATVAAFFDSFQPTQLELGTQSINTTRVTTPKRRSEPSELKYAFTPGTASAVTQNGAYVPATPNFPAPTVPGAALGSIDQSTALVNGISNGANTVQLSSGTITLDYPDLLVALSEAFRPDLAGSALIDIQGDVQSVRGSTATGMVLNDTGNLNLLQFGSVTNSTIIGQPVSHLNIQSRSNVTVLTPSRTITTSTSTTDNDGRNGVTVDRRLQPIGPLSQPNE